MANCSCSTTCATANRGYGCLSSVPSVIGGIPYNCFLPPTNMNYYQNFPFYNGPCGPKPGSQNSSGGSQAPNCCCRPACNPCFCCGSCDNSESETGPETSGNGCCWNPCAPCNPCCPPNPCCAPNPCCGPAALVATSSGAVTPAAGGAVPLTQSTSTSSAISVESDAITFKCPGVYLVTLNSNIPNTSTYAGNVSLALNGQTLGTSTQNFTASAAANNTSQAIVRVSENSTLTVVTSTGGTAINPTAGTNLFTVTVIRIA